MTEERRKYFRSELLAVIKTSADQPENILDKVIDKLRLDLEDPRSEQRIIKIHKGEGYELIPEVVPITGAAGLRAWLKRGFAPEDEIPAAQRELEQLEGNGGTWPAKSDEREAQHADIGSAETSSLPSPPAVAEIRPQFNRDQCPPVLPKLNARNNMVRLASLNDRFIGRTANLWTIHDAITAGRLAVVTGTAGVGKTQLAVEYIWRFGNHFLGGVFWVEAESGRNNMVDRIARSADIQIESGIEEQERVELLWQRLAGSPVLIALNNLPESARLGDWRPAEHSFSVLITTRRRGMAPESEVDLDFFTPEESLALLNSVNPRHTMHDASALIDELGGLPLALELTRGNLDSQRRLDLNRFVRELRKASYPHFWKRIAAQYLDRLPTHHGRSLLGTFRLSWQRVGPLAQSILRAMSVLAPQAVPLRLFRNLSAFMTPDGQSQLAPAAEELVRFSLVNSVGLDAIVGHRLILQFVRETGPGKLEGQQAIDSVIKEMETVWDKTRKYENAPHLDVIVPHAEALFRGELLSDDRRFRLARALTEYSLLLGKYYDAVAWVRPQLPLAERLYGRHSELFSRSQYDLGRALIATGQYEEAESVLRQVVQDCSTTQLALQASIARASLGDVLTTMGKYAEAKTHLEGAVTVLASAFPKGHVTLAFAEANLGDCLRLSGEIEKGIARLNNGYAFMHSTFPAPHPQLAKMRSRLADALQGSGRHQEARPLYEESLNECLVTLPGNHIEVGLASSNLGACLGVLGDYVAADACFVTATAIFERSLRPGHYLIALVQASRAERLVDAGSADMAADVLRVSLQSLAHGDGMDYKDKAAILLKQGRVLLRLGSYDQAITTLSEVLQQENIRFSASMAVLGEIHETCRARIAIASIKLGKQDGREMLNQSMTRLNQTLPKEHVSLRELQRDIAAILGATAVSPE